jgi:hypothetical protein
VCVSNVSMLIKNKITDINYGYNRFVAATRERRRKTQKNTSRFSCVSRSFYFSFEDVQYTAFVESDY